MADRTRGRFITLEGGEGAGKTTQISALAATLQRYGIETVTTREPGGSTGGEAIRSLLLHNAATWSMRTEALLFAAARCDHVEKTVLPALGRGAWVLCDRYLGSSRAYQGAAGGLGDDHILRLHSLGADIIPDRTILLDVRQDVGSRRAAMRDGDNSDRIGGRDVDYHRRVADAFRMQAEADPARFRTIDASGDRAEVGAAVFDAVRDLLGRTA